MGRRILAIIAGVLTGILLVFIGDGTSHSIFPPPAGIDFHNKEVFSAYVRSIPAHVFLLMLAFWLLAAFVGGFIAGKVSKTDWKRSSIITGVILLAGTLLNFFMVPHPVWLMVAAMLLTVPSAWFGGKLGS